MPPIEFQDAVRRVRALLKRSPKVNDPVLVILSGLPGSGKTTFAAKLSHALGAVTIESDLVRKVLFPKPTYSAEENRLVHAVARALMRYYLRSGHSVVADATNLAEWHRQMLRRLAQVSKVPAVLVQTTAPEKVIAARLRDRSARRPTSDFSDADWRVYQMLSLSAEPIRGRHFRVDTTRDLDKSVVRIVRSIRRVRQGSGGTSPST